MANAMARTRAGQHQSSNDPLKLPVNQKPMPGTIVRPGSRQHCASIILWISSARLDENQPELCRQSFRPA